VVIGKPGRRIPQEQALDPRGGLFSVQRCELGVIFSSALRNGRWARISMAPGRFGPWLVTPRLPCRPGAQRIAHPKARFERAA